MSMVQNTELSVNNSEQHYEIVRQIVDFNLTHKEIRALCAETPVSDDEDAPAKIPSHARHFARSVLSGKSVAALERELYRVLNLPAKRARQLAQDLVRAGLIVEQQIDVPNVHESSFLIRSHSARCVCWFFTLSWMHCREINTLHFIKGKLGTKRLALPINSPFSLFNLFNP